MMRLKACAPRLPPNYKNAAVDAQAVAFIDNMADASHRTASAHGAPSGRPVSFSSRVPADLIALALQLRVEDLSRTTGDALLSAVRARLRRQSFFMAA